jgi:recombination protein RecA
MRNKRIYFSTGSTLLDLVVGGGVDMGYSAGSIINIVGDKSTGKTFLANEIIASAYHKYEDKFIWNYDDAESGYTFDSQKLYNMPPICNSNSFKSKTVEDWYCNVRKFLEKIKDDMIGIYVLDSLDGLSSNEILERGDERYKAFKQKKDFDKGSYQMASAKFLSQEFFRGLAGELMEKNVLLIVISQVRDKIGSFFAQQTRAGGKALDFYAHTALWLSNLQKIEKSNRSIGYVVKAKAKKNKTSRPFREAIISLLFDYGIDNVGSNLDFLFDLRGDSGKIKKCSEKIQWEKEENTYTRDELIDKILNEDLCDLIEKKTIEKWEDIEKLVSSNRRCKYANKKKVADEKG